jgi:hypothetical protein
VVTKTFEVTTSNLSVPLIPEASGGLEHDMWLLAEAGNVFSYSQISFNSRTLPTIYSEFEKAEFPLLGILKDIKRNGHPSPKQQINQENIQHGPVNTLITS